MTHLSLRQATAGDLELLYGIHSEAMRPYVERIWGWDEDFQQQRFRQGYDPDTTQVVLSDGRETGFLTVWERTGVVFIAQISIIPEYQGRGIGTALIRDILARGLPVELSVLKLNTRARRLYDAWASR